MEFILFTHLPIAREGDPKKVADRTESYLKKIEKSFERLRSLVWKRPGRRGLIVLFHDVGWRAALEDHRRARKQRRTTEVQLEEGGRFTRELYKRTGGSSPVPWLRIVTSRDLYSFLHGLRGVAARDVARYLGGFTYDSPKIVDAVLRLRAMDSGLPVFRLDEDVLLADPRKPDPWELLERALDESLALHGRLRGNRFVPTGIFSAQYEATTALGSTCLEDWNRGFATRVTPVIRRGGGFDIRDAHRFFGFKDAQGTLDVRRGLVSIGAHPLRAVISGALLYQDPGSVIDLPPFSNLTLRVMWIDDHLRFLLHDALGRFRGFPDDPWDGLRPEVRKNRQPANHYPPYFDTLLLGCIVDRWFCDDPIGAKCSPEEQKRARAGSGTRSDTCFVKSLREAIERTAFRREEKLALKEQMSRDALDALSTVASLWRKLPATTIAGERTRQHLLASPPSKGGRRARRLAVAPVIWSSIEQLVDEVVDYIDWALDWPQLAHAIRLQKSGSFPGDLEWGEAKKHSMTRRASSGSLRLESKQLERLSGSVHDAIVEGGRRWGAPIRVLPSWLAVSRAPGAKTSCLAIQVGGRYVRAGMYEWGRGRAKLVGRLAQKDIRTSVLKRRLSIEEFHQPLVETVRAVTKPQKPIDAIAYCFAQPCTALPDGDAVLEQWAKELYVEEMVGIKVGELLVEELKRTRSPRHRSILPPNWAGEIRVLNDTVAVLRDRPDANAGVIASTGFNVSALAPAGRVEKLANVRAPMIFNLEIGAFAPEILGALDDQLDAFSRNPGRHRLEKAISAAYLGRLYDLASRATMPGKSALVGVTSAKEVFRIARRRTAEGKLATALVHRSADLVAVVLVAVARFLGEPRLAVSAEGRLFDYPRYKSRVETTVGALLAGQRRKVDFSLTVGRHAALRGAASATLQA